MLNLLARHGFVAILIAVLVEEIGIPMPIPTDILIVLAGVESAGHFPRLVLWFFALSVASAAGGSGLYYITRWGGRPLVERFGKYVHLGPEQLTRGESLLERRGWVGIALGRAIPGLRYATVIVCGLFHVPYWRFITAHLVGSSLYIITFLALGATFGPHIIESIHIPSRTLNFIGLVVVAVGLPILIMWMSHRAHPQIPARPSAQRLFWSNVLASFLGATVLAASWSAAATYAVLVGPPRPINIISTLVGWLLGRGLGTTPAYLFIYTGLLLVCLLVSAAYHQFLVPRLSSRIASLPMQVVELALLTACFVAAFLAVTLSLVRYGPLVSWWQNGGVWLILVLVVSIIGYALTTTYARALGLAVLPSFRRVGMGHATRRTLQAEVTSHLPSDATPDVPPAPVAGGAVAAKPPPTKPRRSAANHSRTGANTTKRTRLAKASPRTRKNLQHRNGHEI